jgi:hypothetical protein
MIQNVKNMLMKLHVMQKWLVSSSRICLKTYEWKCNSLSLQTILGYIEITCFAKNETQQTYEHEKTKQKLTNKTYNKYMEKKPKKKKTNKQC